VEIKDIDSINHTQNLMLILFPVLENSLVDTFHTMWTHPIGGTSLGLGGLGMIGGIIWF